MDSSSPTLRAAGASIPDDAVATVEHDGETYYFCIEACCNAFVEAPAYPLRRQGAAELPGD
jgi:YHS domain-containing protein